MATDEMTIEERRKVIRRVCAAYRKAGRQEKGEILDHLEQVTELNRKYLMHLLKCLDLQRKPRGRERSRKYSARLDDTVRMIGRLMDWVCAERLKPALPELAKQLAAHGELSVDAPLLKELEDISVSTLQRYIQRLRQDEPRLPKRQGRLRYHNDITEQVPMKVIPWDIALPGHFEVDLVHHGGTQVSGDCAYTVQFIDVKTGWSERIAILGRSYQRMEKAFARFVELCPISVREIHSDNGSEFINAHLLRFFGECCQGAEFTRSHPWQKNDNRFVEQKNYTLVRAYVGHEVFATEQEVNLLNALYGQMRLYYNYFQPVLRQTERHVETNSDDVRRLVRKQDTAQTPLQRLLQTAAPSEELRDQLLATYRDTNLRVLHESITKALARLLHTPQRKETPSVG